MLKRIKNLWELSQYKPTVTEALVSDGLTERQITLEKDTPPVKAEFIGVGTEEEYKEFEREQEGLKGIFGIGL